MSLRIFEVDHPVTQSLKQARLAGAHIAVPSALTFVPVDLTRASLGEALTRAGFDSRAPAFFSWLGVVAVSVVR
ncbi:MAG: hypothetical protein GEV06_22370 [Luteitalea sp.]|nr:hypothetical protein [Luteitalea sp.]